jgi:HK97 family phage portal protein
MGILDLFKRQNNEKELNDKITQLEATIKSIGVTNASLAGIVNGNFIELETNRLANPFASNYIIYRGIILLAQNIAQLPMRIYKGDTPMDTDFSFPNFDLNNPNAEMSLYELMYACCVYYFYRGEFMAYINLDDARITVEPINPKHMERVSLTRNQIEPQDWRWNNTKIIPYEQLLYAKFLNPDGDRGLGPVDVIKQELINDDRAREYNTKFFENFGKIGGMLTDEQGNANTDDMRKLVNEFNTAHAGSASAHKVLGLPGGIKYSELSQTMAEMEFLESRRDIRDKVLGILGIHKAVFGVTDQVDRAVADTAMRQLWIHTLKPNAIRIQEKFNQQLFKKYFPGYRCYFDFSGVTELQENRTEVLTQAKLFKELGYTMNEINEYFDLGMDEVTEPIGNMRFVPNTYIPIDDLMLEPDSNSKSIDNKIDKIAELIDSAIIKEDNTTTITKATANFLNNYSKVRRSIDKKMAGKFGKYFANQLGKVLSVVKENKSIIKSDELILLAAIRNLLNTEKQVLKDMITPVYNEGALTSSQLAINAINANLKPRIDENVVGNMVNKISDINDYTYRLISKQVVESVAAGESTNDLAKRIQSVYKFNTSRARIISRTESAALVSRSTDAEYKANGVSKKRWLSSRDKETRETHLTNDNIGIVDYNYTYPNNQVFPSDGNGGASNNISCRCTLVPIIE